MAVLLADGTPSFPVFVFKGTREPYRVVHRDGRQHIETVAQCLPRGSYLAYHSEGGGIDKHISIDWTKAFAKNVEDLTAGGRKVLLLYDAYRSHMSLQAFQVLKSGGVIAFALPAHTSGTTQPLDVGLFQPFKAQLNIEVRRTSETCEANVFDVFDLCHFITTAYVRSFTAANFKKAFEAAGIEPFNPSKLIGVAHPLNEHCQAIAVTPQDMESMLEEKRERRREALSVAPVVLHRGFLDTKKGLVLTSDAELKEIESKERRDAEKRERKYNKPVTDDVKFILEAKVRRAERKRFESWRAKRISERYGIPFKMPRSLYERRVLARDRALLKKASAMKEDGSNKTVGWGSGRYAQMTSEELEEHLVMKPSVDQAALSGLGEI